MSRWHWFAVNSEPVWAWPPWVQYSGSTSPTSVAAKSSLAIPLEPWTRRTTLPVVSLPEWDARMASPRPGLTNPMSTQSLEQALVAMGLTLADAGVAIATDRAPAATT